MDLNHARDQRLVVFPQFAKHVQRSNAFRIIVGEVLETSDVPD
jgi:hypothetical protein